MGWGFIFCQLQQKIVKKSPFLTAFFENIGVSLLLKRRCGGWGFIFCQPQLKKVKKNPTPLGVFPRIPCSGSLKGRSRRGGKNIFCDLKRSNLVGDFEINKKILEEDIKLKQIKFGPYKVTTQYMMFPSTWDKIWFPRQQEHI